MRIILLFLLMISNVEAANTKKQSDSSFSSIEKWLKKQGFNTHVNSPKVVQGQAMGYFGGGGISARLKQDSLKIFSSRLPSIAAGCNGIDLDFGSFSMLDSPRYMEVIEQIPSTALAWGTKLAIDHFSPIVSNLIGDFQKQIQDLSQSELNACNIVKGAFKLGQAGLSKIMDKMHVMLILMETITRNQANARTQMRGKKQ